MEFLYVAYARDGFKQNLSLHVHNHSVEACIESEIKEKWDIKSGVFVLDQYKSSKNIKFEFVIDW